MHFGQIPLLHTTHFSVTRSRGCLGQNRLSFTSSVLGAAAEAPPRLNRTAGAALTGGGGGGAGVEAGCGAGAAGAGAAAGALPRVILICVCGGGVAAAGATATPGGGGAISIAGANPCGAAGTEGDTDNPTGPVAVPNCWRTCSKMRGDKSTPHSGHANVSGLRTISGVASKAYFAPQSQMTFMAGQGFGFNNTTFVRNGRSKAAAAGDVLMLPSVNIRLPPYL